MLTFGLETYNGIYSFFAFVKNTWMQHNSLWHSVYCLHFPVRTTSVWLTLECTKQSFQTNPINSFVSQWEKSMVQKEQHAIQRIIYLKSPACSHSPCERGVCNCSTDYELVVSDRAKWSPINPMLIRRHLNVCQAFIVVYWLIFGHIYTHLLLCIWLSGNSEMFSCKKKKTCVLVQSLLCWVQQSIIVQQKYFTF